MSLFEGGYGVEEKGLGRRRHLTIVFPGVSISSCAEGK